MSNPDNSNLDRFKLETSFGDGSVTHTTYTTNRKAPVQTTWKDSKTIRSGGFGVVILQEADGGQLRAVKKIYNRTGKMDVLVMAEVAHVGTKLQSSESLPTKYLAQGSVCPITWVVCEHGISVHRNGIYEVW